MKMLLARRTGRGFRFVVHLDTTKLLADGAPDPVWTFSARWTAPARADDETIAAYTTRLAAWAAGIRADLKISAVAALAELVEANDPGTPLPQEGQIF